MKSILRDALEFVGAEFSPDRVIADPALNERFIAECRRRGLQEAIADLNRSLLNLRKTGGLSGRARPKRTHFEDQDAYQFASEMAVRFLERRDKISLDQIICDPEKAAEFDALARNISPGFESLQYRWAALCLRKTKRLEPELVARVAPPLEVLFLRGDAIDWRDLPAVQGLYLLFTANQMLYVGETENLRTRLKKHLDHSDNKGFARWMWELGTTELHLELHVLDQATTVRVRKALELELIRSRQPLFNVKR